MKGIAFAALVSLSACGWYGIGGDGKDDEVDMRDAAGNSDGNASVHDASPPDAMVDACVDCQFAANFPIAVSYVNSGGERVSYSIEDELVSPQIRFRFDDADGRFAQRIFAGESCMPAVDNPNAIEINVSSNMKVDACTFQGSWDAGQISCQPDQLNAINGQGFEFTLNTDGVAMEPAPGCDNGDPRFPHATSAWFEIRFTSGGQSVTKRIDLFKLPLN